MTKLHMLDTDTCAFVLRRSCNVLLVRIQEAPVEQQIISIVTLAEQLYGVLESNKNKANGAGVVAFARHVTVND